MPEEYIPAEDVETEDMQAGRGLEKIMPAFYAHHRFGETVFQELSEPLRTVVLNHRPQFDIGLQGPDLFFFYRPYTGGGRVAKYGHQLHEISAMPFFERGLRVVERKGLDSREYAYMLGFICHFALDSRCHGYINRMVEKTGVLHLEIEEEFEKYLLRADGKNPLSFPIADLVPQDMATAEAAAAFYENITPAVAKQALSDLQAVKRLLTAPGKVKQSAVNTALRLTFHYRQLKGLMNQRKDNPRCSRINEELYTLFEGAEPFALELADSFHESLLTGKALREAFDRNFL